MAGIAYAEAIAELLRDDRLNELGPGKPNRQAEPRLRALQIDRSFAPFPVHDRDMAKACFAGLWLYHDFLDQSHRISQGIYTTTGSYWHGLMHRREPDWSNSKYWFHRVGSHPVFEDLVEAARELASEQPADADIAFLTRQKTWDPMAFIDLCQACVEGHSPHEMLCRRIQQREWRLLFDYCYRLALGMP